MTVFLIQGHILLLYYAKEQSHDTINTGYGDFYSRSDAELCWDIQDSRGANNFKKVFSDVKPVEGDVLRLAFVAGRHRLRVTFLNRVVTSPGEIEVNIESGRITPISVALTEAGPTVVQSKEGSRGNTFYGRAGRRTKINSDETVIAKTIWPGTVLL